MNGALLQAVQDNDVEKVKMLLAQGVNVNFTNENGWTALHYAARDNKIEVVQFLLTHDVKINRQTDDGNTPLMLAAYNGHLQLCKSLLAQGANSTLTDEQDKTAANHAQGKGYKLLAAYLNDPNIDISGIPWKVLNDSVKFYYQKGNYSKSGYFAEQAYQRAQREFSKTHASYGTSLNNLAGLYASMGRYPEAEPLYKEALQVTATALGKDHPDYGTHLNNLAGLYESMGRYTEAEPLYKEALQIDELNLSKDHPNYGTTLNNLAGLYASMGRYPEAEPLYKEALQVTEASLGKDHPNYGTYLNNLAELYLSMGRYPEAEPLYKEALQNAATALGKDHPSYGTHLNNLALLYKSMGRYPEAEPLYKEALQVTASALGKDHPDYGTYLNNLAGLYESMGRYVEAEPLYLQANDIIYHNLNQSFAGLSEKEKKQYLQTVEHYFRIYHSFALRRKIANPSITTLSYNNTLINKGMLLQSSLDMRENILQSSDSALLQTYDNWIGLKNQISKLYSLPIKERYVSTDSLEKVANDLEKQLNRGATAFRQQTQALQVQWEDVKHSLSENEAAIEFISFRYRNDTAWTDSTLYAALVLRPEDEYPHMIELFEEKQLQTLLVNEVASDEGFISDLYATRGVGVVNAGQTFKGDSLYQLIWQPLDSLLENVQAVYFSPSGLLHQIAFTALPYQQGLLSERFNLHQLSSTRLLAVDASENAITSAVVYGGIDYDTEPAILESNAAQSSTLMASLLPELSRGKSRGTSWQFLPGTTTESEKVYKLLNANDIHTAHLQADQAQEETFKALGKAKSPGIIHVASHGFFFADIDKKQPEENELFTGEDTYRLAEDPLLRSGLLFAGANHVWEGGSPLPGVEDGILTAYEVAQLNLSNTELVVLSACETGLGDVQGSEGVYGLQRAFKMAGAKNLIMSLWKVPDAQTVELMEKFYTYWLEEDQPIRDAFRQAQQEMKDKYDPYYWAAFVLVE